MAPEPPPDARSPHPRWLAEPVGIELATPELTGSPRHGFGPPSPTPVLTGPRTHCGVNG
ncbi:MAG: hypothetical protein ACJ74U_08095 [Jatrophihabitantaceae bacterium]